MKRSIDWFVGLYEGEGHISSSRRQVQLVIRSTDEDVLRDVVDTVGGNYTCVRDSSAPSHWKSIYQWRFNTSVAVARYPERMQLIEYLFAKCNTRRSSQIAEAIDKASTFVP